MSSIVDRFFISVGLKTEDVKQGMQDLNNKLTSGFKSIAANCIAPLAGALSAGSIFSSFIEEATKLDKLSKSLGVNVESMQAWMGAAEELGVEGDEIAELFHDINDWSSDLLHNDAGTLKEFVERGLVDGFTDAKGAMLSTEDMILKISGAMEKLGPQEATGLLRRLGVGNKDLAGMLAQGPEQLKAYIERQKELGLYTKQDTETARQFSKTIYEVTRSFKMALVPILAKGTPLLSCFGNAMTEAFIYARKHGIVLQTVLIGLATIILARLLPAIRTMTMAMLRNPLVLIITALLMLGLIVEDFFGYLDGKKTALGEFWAQFGTADEIKEKFAGLLETLQGVVKAITEFKISDYISPDVIKVIVDAFGDLLGMAVSIGIALYDLGKAIMKAFTKDGPSPFVDALKSVIRLLFTILGCVFSVMAASYSFFDSILGLAIEVVTGIINYFTDGSGTIKDIFDGICEFVSWFCGMVSKLISGLCSGIVGLFRSMSEGIFSIFGRIGDKIGSLKSGFLEMIGLGKNAERVAASGRGGRGNNTTVTDNSTKNYYPISPGGGVKNTAYEGLIDAGLSGTD